MGKLKSLVFGLAVAGVTLGVGIGIAVYLKQRSQEKRAAQASPVPAANQPGEEGELVTDERFFSRAVMVPTGEVTNERRIKFALELEQAIDQSKTGMQDIQIRAEAPDKDVIALYAVGVTREKCSSLNQSKLIQRLTASGFRTLSCQDKDTNYLFSTPIKNPKGEIRIGP